MWLLGHSEVQVGGLKGFAGGVVPVEAAPAPGILLDSRREPKHQAGMQKPQIRKICGKVFCERRKKFEEKSKTAPFEKPNPKGCATQFKSLSHPPVYRYAV
jgi:hypothetical protein